MILDLSSGQSENSSTEPKFRLPSCYQNRWGSASLRSKLKPKTPGYLYWALFVSVMSDRVAGATATRPGKQLRRLGTIGVPQHRVEIISVAPLIAVFGTRIPSGTPHEAQTHAKAGSPYLSRCASRPTTTVLKWLRSGILNIGCANFLYEFSFCAMPTCDRLVALYGEGVANP